MNLVIWIKVKWIDLCEVYKNSLTLTWLKAKLYFRHSHKVQTMGALKWHNCLHEQKNDLLI